MALFMRQFHHLMLGREVMKLSYLMVQILRPMIPVLPSIIEDITISIIRNQMLLREEWMKKFMDLSTRLFHHSMLGREVMMLLSQMVPLLETGVLFLSSIINIIRNQMLQREEWMRKFMVL